MASNWQKSNETTYSISDSSSNTVQLSNSLTNNIHDVELRKQTLMEEVKEKFFIFFVLIGNCFLVYIVEKTMQ
jgi:hypothetical protein